MNAPDRKRSSKVKIRLKNKDGMDFEIEATGKAAENICRNLARILSRVLSACHNRSGKQSIFFDLLSTAVKFLGSIIGLFMRNYFLLEVTMDFSSCKLYGVKTVKELQNLLGFKLYEYHDNSKIYNNFYSIKILNNTRLIEEPSYKLKRLQKRIYALLSCIEFPEYLFSCKKRSFIAGAALHANQPSVIIKVDIKKFYPSTHRDKIYKFWKNDMLMSSSVAEIMTNITTISLPEQNTISSFFVDNNITSLNHIPTGAPTSPILAFLCNWKMYDKINKIVTNHNGTLSIYVDDITVSGVNNPKEVLFLIRDEIFHNGYRISARKSGIKHNLRAIEINGVIITKDGELRVPNRINKKLMIKKASVDYDSSAKASIDGLSNYRKMIKKVSKGSTH